jgi:squalene-hopene/tetraprenyl-beta-curcumene cyclase
VEETALAVEALAGSEHVQAAERGAAWLAARVEDGTWREPSPIGFYFAKLWYYERLYPQVWTAGALGKIATLS